MISGHAEPLGDGALAYDANDQQRDQEEEQVNQSF